jgi:hypothetical protein
VNIEGGRRRKQHRTKRDEERREEQNIHVAKQLKGFKKKGSYNIFNFTSSWTLLYILG